MKVVLEKQLEGKLEELLCLIINKDNKNVHSNTQQRIQQMIKDIESV